MTDKLLQAALVKALEYRVRCGHCNGTGKYGLTSGCANCSGTGKAPFFQLTSPEGYDRLRGKLDIDEFYHDCCSGECRQHGVAERDCEGRGWLPCTFDVLLEAVWKRWTYAILVTNAGGAMGFSSFLRCPAQNWPTSEVHTETVFRGYGTTQALAVLDAVCKAAEAEGAA